MVKEKIHPVDYKYLEAIFSSCLKAIKKSDFGKRNPYVVISTSKDEITIQIINY